MQNIIIIDYGVGNLFSLKSSFNATGRDDINISVSSEPDAINKADKIILPGVGAFGDAADKLRKSGLVEPLLNAVKNGKPILGICLGMQLLFDRSFEYGVHEGLGLIPGEIVAIADLINKNNLKNNLKVSLKIPHIGWNALKFKNKSRLFSKIKENDCVYFVHSYAAVCDNESQRGVEHDKTESQCGVEHDKFVTAVTEYGAEITASVEHDNIYGCQFHPEKSGAVGLNILRAFCEI